MDRFLCLQAFVRVAETRCFADAARQLNVAPPVITQRVNQLEEYMQAALFHRSTRSVQLSEAGTTFLEESSEIVARMDSLLEHMRALKGTPDGCLRLQVVPGFGLDYLADFMTEYPNIEIDISADDGPVNPVDRGYDISLQIYRPGVETLIERPLFPVRRVFCASAEYLAANSAPKTPADLAQHCVGTYSGYVKQERWNFQLGNEEYSIMLRPKFRSNSIHMLRQFVSAGRGITCLPTLACWKEILSGELTILLPEYELPMLELLAIYSTTQRGALKVQLFLDFIARRYSENQPWDEALRTRGLLVSESGGVLHKRGRAASKSNGLTDRNSDKRKADPVVRKNKSRQPARSSTT